MQATIDHGQSTCRTTRQTALADKDKSNFKLRLFQLMRSACGMPQICHNSSSRSHQIRSPRSVNFALHYMPDFNCTRNCLQSINIYRTTNELLICYTCQFNSCFHSFFFCLRINFAFIGRRQRMPWRQSAILIMFNYCESLGNRFSGCHCCRA